ncbi:MAG: flagellar brake protein, partial [Thermodesulfovibrionales bacterium]|nr:flagellar brake protein [Thermodesulfovibrionales bacterium]
GWDTNSFFVVKSPLLRTMRLTSSDDCIIRFVKDGVAYGFQTNMISMQYTPAPIIFFKFPTEIKSMSFRKSKRVQTNINAKILKRMKDNTFLTANVRILDISESGCLIEIPAEDEINDEIYEKSNFYVNFLILDKNIEIDCTVRNIREKNNFYLLGTEFINVGAETKQIINSFINFIDSSSNQ